MSEAEAALYPTLSLAPSVVRSRSSSSVSSIAGGVTGAGGAITTGATTGATTGGGTATGASTTPRTIYSLSLIHISGASRAVTGVGPWDAAVVIAKALSYAATLGAAGGVFFVTYCHSCLLYTSRCV